MFQYGKQETHIQETIRRNDYPLIIILLQKSFNPICKIVHKKINFISPISTQNNTLPYSLFIVAIVILQ